MPSVLSVIRKMTEKHRIFIPRHAIVAGIMVSRWTSVCMSFRISFPGDNLSKHKWTFTKLGICALIL